MPRFSDDWIGFLRGAFHAARLLGEPAPHASTNTALLPDLDELDSRISASNLRFIAYVTQLERSQLNQSLNFQFVDGKPGSMTRQEILFHIVNHGTYHRGAIGHALDLANAVRPADTYTIFIHAFEPGRRENACRVTQVVETDEGTNPVDISPFGS